ncbi:MAG TPA: ATP-binding protein [Chthoniobacteraceae bacterium]|jgi:serine/threonine-protein kinase RsbW
MMMELHATPQEVMRGVEALQEFARAAGVPEKVIFSLALALEECASNVVNHAYQCDAEQTLHVTLQHLGHSFVIELRDRGPAFDPLQTAAPNFEADLEEREIGGLGIALARHYLDDLHYSRVHDENVLRLTKLLPSA